MKDSVPAVFKLTDLVLEEDLMGYVDKPFEDDDLVSSSIDAGEVKIDLLSGMVKDRYVIRNRIQYKKYISEVQFSTPSQEIPMITTVLHHLEMLELMSLGFIIEEDKAQEYRAAFSKAKSYFIDCDKPQNIQMESVCLAKTFSNKNVKLEITLDTETPDVVCVDITIGMLTKYPTKITRFYPIRSGWRFKIEILVNTIYY